MPSKRGTLPTDLRSVARAPIAKRRLADVFQLAAEAPAASRLWLGERWPWTPGTDAALATRRPRWAVFAMDLAALRRYAAMEPQQAVREMNRDHDPWPIGSRQPIPSPVPPTATTVAESPSDAEISEPSSRPRRTRS